MQINGERGILLLAMAAAFVFQACSFASPAGGSDGAASLSEPDVTVQNSASKGADAFSTDDSVRSAVNFEHELDTYEPLKDHYDFYFTYKTVHPWWDAVALGMEDAQRQYLDRGIKITYEYMAPDGASAEDQKERRGEV